MLQTPKLPPKRMRCIFCVWHAAIQHIAHAVISVLGTNALLLSVAKHLPASGHDLPALYSFSVRYALQTTQLPPKQMHRHFWAQCVSIQHRPRYKSAVCGNCTWAALCDTAFACI